MRIVIEIDDLTANPVVTTSPTAKPESGELSDVDAGPAPAETAETAEATSAGAAAAGGDGT